MARYRPVDNRLWSDRRFLLLSERGRMLWLFLLTTPSLPIPGVIIGGEASMAEQLGWSIDEYREGLRELVDRGMKVRIEGRLVWLQNALKYQRPSGPTAIVGMAKYWDDIPDGELKKEIWQALKIACKTWSKIFEKHLGMGDAMVAPIHHAQLDMEGLDTRSRTRSRSLTETRTPPPESSRAPAQARDPAPPSTVPAPEVVVVDVPDGTVPVAERPALLRKVGQLHAEAFAAAKLVIGSDAMGPSVVGHFTEIREVLDELNWPPDALERCCYAIELRATEAVTKRTMQYFGPAMWKRQNLAKILALTRSELTGHRVEPKAASQRDTRREMNELGIELHGDDESDDDEHETRPMRPHDQTLN